MIEFIDKTADKSGTPLNRATMMAIQGFESVETRFPNDTTIVETNANGETLTTIFNDDGSITETFVGEKTIVKTTTFSQGGISEVIS